MTKSFAASVAAFGEMTERQMLATFLGSAQDTTELMTRRQPSVRETGGSFEVGKVPVDTGQLINSFALDVGGAVVAEGRADYSAALATADIGDPIKAAFTAPHARAVEYGAEGREGRFFVREAVQQWPAIVDTNARHVTGRT